MSSTAGKQPLLHIRSATGQASLVICTVSPEPSLFAHISVVHVEPSSNEPSHVHGNIDVTYCLRPLNLNT